MTKTTQIWKIRWNEWVLLPVHKQSWTLSASKMQHLHQIKLNIVFQHSLSFVVCLDYRKKNRQKNLQNDFVFSNEQDHGTHSKELNRAMMTRCESGLNITICGFSCGIHQNIISISREYRVATNANFILNMQDENIFCIVLA